MGNCCPCIKFRKKRDNNYKNMPKSKNTNNYIITSPDNFILYGHKRDRVSRSYFSPNCTKRPLYAQRVCDNCDRLFYSYNFKEYCSNECKFTVKLANQPAPIYTGYFSD